MNKSNNLTLKKGKVNIAIVKMLISTIMCIICIIYLSYISVISVIMFIMLINTLIKTMRIIETYLRDRDRRRVMSAAVFPGVVWR